MFRLFVIILLLYPFHVFAAGTFEEKHLGYRFTLGDQVEYDHNPHSMRKTKIFHDGKHVGGFTVSVLPDEITKEEFIASGRGYYLRKYPDAVVAIQRGVNSAHLEYSEVRVTFSLQGKDYIEKKMVFIKERDGAPGQAKIPMMYTFHFLYSPSTSKETVAALSRMVDTFELIPNDGVYNLAIKQAVGR